jgi:hypothetical protein
MVEHANWSEPRDALTGFMYAGRTQVLASLWTVRVAAFTLQGLR